MTSRVALYARQSYDPKGDELAVTRQLEECRAYAAERGWEVAVEFVDNDRSATSGKARPGFEALLAGKPDAILVWHVDRLCRVTRDLERVIELGVNVYAIKAGHIDLSTPAGRAVARTVTAWATYEGEQRTERQRAANDQRARSGLPFMGRRAFGYAPGGMELVPGEAGVYRAAVDRLLDGESLRSITKWVNGIGATTTAGNPWGTTEMRRLLANPRHAGLRVHRGEIVGRGVWPAIVDEDTHRAVVAILSDPARRPKGRPRAYLLSGVARCGACGEDVSSRVYGRIERRGPIYVCETTPHIGRRIEPVDQYVEAVAVERLSRPDVASKLFATQESSEELAELQAEERSLRARLDGLAESYASGDIDRRQLAAGTARIRSRLDDIAVVLPSLVVQPAAARLVTQGDVAGAWAELSVEAKRSIVDEVMDVTLHPPGRGARTFRPETVDVRFKV